MNFKILFLTSLFLIPMFCIAQLTFVPDDNFEQALIDLGYDDVLDNYVLTSSIETVTILTIDNLSISDLTGIEDFLAIQELRCHNNNLTELNVEGLVNLYDLRCANNNLNSLTIGQNNSLYWLNCRNNNLSSIDISQNPNLYEVFVNDNNLSSLGISQNPNLNWLDIGNNQLTTLDLSNNQMLRKLDIAGNNFQELNVTNNINLESLECELNMISSLDVSQNVQLYNLWCYANQMTNLDVRNGNNVNFDIFNSNNNPELTCIFVDNAAYSTSNWEHVDPASTFVETQEACDLLSISENELNDFDVILYPNPTSQYINVKLNQNLIIEYIKIYDFYGKLLIESSNDSVIDLGKIHGNLFLVVIETNKGIILKKVLKD